ncbi:putative bifunctional diguanylate cyclase/phosphodiesterase [Alteromonas lipotrueiana]|uniref:putative bifunctional diguanylate cyclase/phosphodiesterase n=1 Tax=Alteromonas lipotrueiana TaxID=2803815 RepID=UPI001C45DCB8|nr:bifunctional diguanylate cyclase/phosphodiesterase [Alteromonas lipotrueiana]
MPTSHQSLLTIPNRYAFISEVDKCAQCHDNFTIVLIDVVRFSDVTTSLGIDVGDRFLLQIANRIISFFDDTICFGRVSGDVFAIMFSGKAEKSLMLKRVERLTEHFKAPMHHENHAFIADFNAGAVSAAREGFQLNSFISRAEAALKQAKENRYENFYMLEPCSDSKTGRRLALKADLRRAMSRDELELYFQPKVDLTTLEITGAECLLRWNHPLDGVVFPGPLIEAAESYHMMSELASWTLEQAFQNLANMQMAGLDPRISINISPTQLYDSQLIPHFTKLCQRYGFKADRFEFELTEDVALSNSLMVREQLSRLKALGIAIAVDDFGKGYSNLAYIRELDITALKIDKNFVMGLTDNPVNQAIIKAAKIIGDAKQCEVVAEGIETVDQLHILRELGIKTGQGFLFSRAVPLADFIKLAHQEIIIGSSPLRKRLG